MLRENNLNMVVTFNFDFSFRNVQTGDPPWPAPRSVGRGALTSCLYSVLVKDDREKEVINRSKSVVQTMQEKRVLNLRLIKN